MRKIEPREKWVKDTQEAIHGETYGQKTGRMLGVLVLKIS